MSSNRPLKQHFIPKMLLKNFCDDSGQLSVFNKVEKKLYRRKPEDVFVKRHLYTLKNAEEISENYEVEEEFSRLESRADPVIQSIIKCARKCELPNLSTEDGDIAKRFYLAMVRRNPEFMESIWEQNKLFNDAFSREDQKRDYKIRFAAGSDRPNQAHTKSFCRKTGLMVAVIYKRKRSFVIGSRGVAIIQSAHEQDPSQGSWLPVAYDVAIGPTHDSGREFLLPLDDSNDWIIKRINKSSFERSRIIAGRSEILIRSLAGTIKLKSK